MSKLNFSHYALFDQLETICKEKMLTTALIHLIITSTTGNDKNACLQILDNVFSRFRSAKKCKSLDEVKEMCLKDNVSKHEIEASYEYIGLKLLYIIKLFMKGEKFPSGKLANKQKPYFLSQSVEFLLREKEATELMKLSSRTFFTIASEMFLNDNVAKAIKDLYITGDEIDLKIPYTHTQIIEILQDHILIIQKEEFIKFEYAYFIIKIAEAQVCKENAKELSIKVHQST